MDTVQIPEYVAQIFPNLGANEIQTATSLYTGLGSNFSQAVAVIGECEFFDRLCERRIDSRMIPFSAIFICPTYYLTIAFNGTSFKVGASRLSRRP